MATGDEKSPWTVEADDATFQKVAVERSRELLVVVDFWAAWCQPCRMLGPMLEKLAREYSGKFLLVKVDTDQAPNIAGGFGVQSIPAVYALRDGQLLDAFVGLLPEGQIRAWIERLLPTEAEQIVADARKLAANDVNAAEARFREAARLDPNLSAAQIALAELLVGQSRYADARAVIAALEQRGFLEPEAETVKSALHMAEQAAQAGDIDKLRAAVDADPKNLPAKLDLAKALAAKGQHAEALAIALALVQTHQAQFAAPAREFMVDLFRVLGDDDPLVTEYRRKLSTALY